MRFIRVVVALVVLGALAAAGYFTLNRVRSGDKSGVSLEAFQQSGSRWRTLAFHVRYRMDTTLGTAQLVWYHAPADRTRVDFSYTNNDAVPRNRTYIEDGSAEYSCREPGRCARGNDLFDDPTASNLDALSQEFLVPIDLFTAPRDVNDTAPTPAVSRSDERFAGENATCFRSVQEEGVYQICYSDDGIPLFLSLGDGITGPSFTAVEITRGGTDADFAPPYALSP